MSYEKRFPDWENRVREASETSETATGAAALLGIKFSTYKKYAEKYDCYRKDQGAGARKSKDIPNGRAIPLEDILIGLHPQYQTNKLRIRLIKENIFDHICNNCGMREWLGSAIPLELEHRDGCCSNHRRENLELLCPNCHALTETYRGRNKGLQI